MWVIFGSVWFLSNKNNQIEFKKKAETGSNRSVSVRFGFLEQKPVQTGLTRFFSGFAQFFRFCSVFFRFFSVRARFGSVQFFRTKTGSNRFDSVFFRCGLVFSVWLGFALFFSGFFRFGFGLVRFGFFGSRLKKSKPNRTEPVSFFKILIDLIGSFSRFGFFSYFFFWFSQFNRFFDFFKHLYFFHCLY